MASLPLNDFLSHNGLSVFVRAFATEECEGLSLENLLELQKEGALFDELEDAADLSGLCQEDCYALEACLAEYNEIVYDKMPLYPPNPTIPDGYNRQDGYIDDEEKIDDFRQDSFGGLPLRKRRTSRLSRPRDSPHKILPLCQFCHKKEVHVGGNGKESRTCSKTCQKKYENRPRCLLPNCEEPVYKSKDGREHPFCSKSCKEKLDDMASKQGGAYFIEMDQNHRKFKHILSQISKRWDKTAIAQFDDIETVIMIHNPTRWSKYTSYRRKLETKYKDDSNKTSWSLKVNQQRRFHGTFCKCALKKDGNGEIKPCQAADCAICGIVNNGFDMARIAQKSKTARFGQGIYLTEVSAKAHDYTGIDMKHTSGGGVRWMLLCHVALGDVCALETGDSTLTTPPNGKDSVVGLTKKDSANAELNYSECVVYSADAVYPCYIIVYKYKASP